MEEMHINSDYNDADYDEKMYFLLTTCVPRLQWMRLTLPEPEYDDLEYCDPGDEFDDY